MPLDSPLITASALRTPSRREERRIALFTGNYNHIGDGVSFTLNRLVSHLEAEGTEVLVFGPTVENPPVNHAGRLHPVRSMPAPGRPEYRISLGFSKAAKRAFEAFDPTLVHIATPDVLGNRALRFAKKKGLPVVASYHTHFSSYLKYYGFEELEGFLWKYLRRFYRQCEHIYVPSHSMAAVLRAHEIKTGLRLWERGVETSLFNPDKRSLTWRRTLGIADDEVIILFVGRLVWEKGLDVYASVVERLTSLGIPHRSLVVGDGPAQNDLMQRLPDTIFTGYLGGDALARAYASSDVFLFPSDTETFGNVTLEAMASGLPAVCANATGSNELVVPGVTGYLAEPGKADAFFDDVARLVTRPEFRHEMGIAALERSALYDWRTILEKISAYYDQVLLPEPAEARGDGSMHQVELAPVNGALVFP